MCTKAKSLKCIKSNRIILCLPHKALRGFPQKADFLFLLIPERNVHTENLESSNSK